MIGSTYACIFYPFDMNSFNDVMNLSIYLHGDAWNFTNRSHNLCKQQKCISNWCQWCTVWHVYQYCTNRNNTQHLPPTKNDQYSLNKDSCVILGEFMSMLWCLPWHRCFHHGTATISVCMFVGAEYGLKWWRTSLHLCMHMLLMLQTLSNKNCQPRHVVIWHLQCNCGWVNWARVQRCGLYPWNCIPWCCRSLQQCSTDVSCADCCILTMMNDQESQKLDVGIWWVHFMMSLPCQEGVDWCVHVCGCWIWPCVMKDIMAFVHAHVVDAADTVQQKLPAKTCGNLALTRWSWLS